METLINGNSILTTVNLSNSVGNLIIIIISLENYVLDH